MSLFPDCADLEVFVEMILVFPISGLLIEACLGLHCFFPNFRPRIRTTVDLLGVYCITIDLHILDYNARSTNLSVFEF